MKSCLSLFVGSPVKYLRQGLGQPGLEPKKFSHINLSLSTPIIKYSPRFPTAKKKAMISDSKKKKAHLSAAN